MSPSKLSSFTSCGLAFRLSAIDRLPEPPTVATVRGTLVHGALERLFMAPAADRTVDAAVGHLAVELDAMAGDPDGEFAQLGLSAEERDQMLADGEVLVGNYFLLEDPGRIEPIGVEVKVQVEVGGVMLRGIIDRLDLDADGGLVVTDYKTGRAPKAQYEQSRLEGVQFYALMCERLFGVRPVKVQLLHLAEPVTISTVPTGQSVGALERKIAAVWAAVERACGGGGFQPRPSVLCDWCGYQDLCPAYGGTPPEFVAEPKPAGVPVGF